MLPLDSSPYVRYMLLSRNVFHRNFIIILLFVHPADYIHVCKEDDPKLESCITQSVESLRSRISEGIPELDVPSIEPLEIGNLLVSQKTKARAGLQITAKDIKAYNASNYHVFNMK